MGERNPPPRVELVGDYATEWRDTKLAHRRKLVRLVTKALLESPARQTQYQQSPHVVAGTVRDLVAAILSETELKEEDKQQ